MRHALVLRGPRDNSLKSAHLVQDQGHFRGMELGVFRESVYEYLRKQLRRKVTYSSVLMFIGQHLRVLIRLASEEYVLHLFTHIL